MVEKKRAEKAKKDTVQPGQPQVAELIDKMIKSNSLQRFMISIKDRAADASVKMSWLEKMRTKYTQEILLEISTCGLPATLAERTIKNFLMVVARMALKGLHLIYDFDDGAWLNVR